MKQGTVLFGLLVILTLGGAQNSPSATPNPKSPDAPGEASAAHIYGPRDGIKPPKVVSSPDPEYPSKAHGKQGTVALWLVVGSNGLPREIEVKRSLGPELDKAAVEAVRKWKFAPATKDGKPVASKINLEISFRTPLI